MKKPILVTFVLGTRPEAIKLAPVIIKFKSDKSIVTRVILTGQHIEMVEQVMKLFNIKEDLNLEIMKDKQSLTHITNNVLSKIQKDLKSNRPNLLIIQGDTTSAFAAALGGFYEQIPIGHVEAGLRSGVLLDPFPEEANRKLISQISSLHFAPTKQASDNLKMSKISGEIHITGNTVIDALLSIKCSSKLPFLKDINLIDKQIILSTIHRRENWGKKINQIADAIKRILDKNKSSILLMPLHKNETVRKPLRKILGTHPRVFLTEPLQYDQLVASMKACKIVLTDSGGLQEEAPSLGKPVLVLRETSERVEALQAGTAKLVGTNPDNIFNQADLLLNDKKEYDKMSKIMNPYGDGKSSDRILSICKTFLNIE